MAKTITTQLCERATLYGIEALSDVELLCVTTGIDRIKLQETLDKHSIFEIMTLLDTIDLRPSQKIRIEALFQINKRISRAQFKGGIAIRTPMDVGQLFLKEMQFKANENVMIALLNVRNRLIRIEQIAAGGVGSAMICPREIAKIALRHNAVSVILSHNHPSGDPTPSQEDIVTTKALAEGLQLLNLKLLDHIIVAGTDYISLKQQGLY